MEMLTQEMIEQAKQDGTACYDWGRNFKNKNIYDLYLTIKNCGYRIATYSIKTKRCILTCPEIHIPSEFALRNWIEHINNKEKADE